MQHNGTVRVLMPSTLLVIIEPFHLLLKVPEDLFSGRWLSSTRASLYNNFGNVCLLYCVLFILCVLKHLPGLSTSRIIPAGGRCVVIAVARKCGSTTTSNVFCRKIDSSGSGEGKPFQLQKLEDRSFWTNEEVKNEGLKIGCLLEYRDGTCCQSLLGRRCKLFIFCRNAGRKPQVSFRYNTNSTVYCLSICSPS